MSELQSRSEKHLRRCGYLVASVERRKSFPAKGKEACNVCGQIPLISIASDLWNVFDLVALKPVTGFGHVPQIVFVQVTSASNHSTRRNKILASSEAKLCILSGCRVLIQSWKKVQHRFQAHDEWVTLDQFCVGLPDTVEQFYEDQRRQKLLARGTPGRELPLSPFLKDEEMSF